MLVATVITGVIYWLRRHRTEPPPTPTPFETKGKLQVVALDVGQGDGFLIISPGGKTALIDAGSAQAGDDVVAALQRRNLRTIDLAVATHPHADHIAGLRRVIGKLTVSNLLDSGQNFASDEYDRLQRAVKTRKVQFIKAKKGWKFSLDSGVELEAFNPRGDGRWITNIREGGSVENANSVVLRLSYGNFAMIFTGDAETDTETELVKHKFLLRAQVLKVGHHGSRHATSEKFLNAVKPEAAIISCGNDNRYGHPSQPTLDRLKKSNVKVYRTDLGGEIAVVSDGNTFQVSTARQMNLASLWQGRVELEDLLVQPKKAAAASKLKKEEID
ncbi:MAG: ComEC/Rec2 family competence protein [Acidobacteriota bacterium]|nr:ComEC/Rec2 family competence protein [Acidobacteriota bacterium]